MITNKLFFSAIIVLFGATVAEAQLRIVAYNTLDPSPEADLGVVLQAIGEERVNGFAKPIDILALQEQAAPTTTTQAIVDLLNGIYGAGTYSRSTTFTAGGSLRQAFVYRNDTVELIDEEAVTRSTVNGFTPPREALRGQFRPIGYDSSADFYVYNSHFKAGGGPDEEGDEDRGRRAAEAVNLRNDADALGEGTHAIFLGDFNLRNDGTAGSSFDPAEPAFGTLLASGPGQAFDPVANIAPAVWKNNFDARFVHTHGGSEIDDRFDFQLPTGEWFDGEGLDFIGDSYRAFGNNGSTYNDPINVGNNIVFDFGTNPTYSKTQVLNALNTASDHLPVVADYQLPSVLSASIVGLESQVEQGADETYSLLIENVADVVSALGADDLDYSVTIANGSVVQFSGSDLADGIADTFDFTLNTSTLGLNSIFVNITSDAQGTGGGSLQFSLPYTVVAATLDGDFNADGFVDILDYTVWRDGLGSEYTIGQYDLWRNNFGSGTPPSGAINATGSVPEPATTSILLLAALGGVCGRKR
ncbi:MAG: hypothetical protein AAGF31_09210 [Planctomycetota bacterium]